jgi:REP element-mobilizing transposase RayT
MTRLLRIEFAGSVYHLIFRGNARQVVFLDEKDFVDFLGVYGF